jgi:hypothetical protein
LNVRPARSELNGAELVYCAHTAFPLLSWSAIFGQRPHISAYSVSNS